MSKVRDIIVATDASGTGWGAVLMQAEPGSKKRHPARYESGVWTGAELYGVPLILETDATTLVAQLNRSVTDIPSAVVTRWIAWARMLAILLCGMCQDQRTLP